MLDSNSFSLSLKPRGICLGCLPAEPHTKSCDNQTLVAKDLPENQAFEEDPLSFDSVPRHMWTKQVSGGSKSCTAALNCGAMIFKPNSALGSYRFWGQRSGCDI